MLPPQFDRERTIQSSFKISLMNHALWFCLLKQMAPLLFTAIALQASTTCRELFSVSLVTNVAQLLDVIK